MKKSLATLIDELTVTNIKIFNLAMKMEKKKYSPEDAKKLEELNKYHKELCYALDKSKAMSKALVNTNKDYVTMKKSLATLIDELTVTNIKIFNLVDKIRENKHTRADAKKAQDLNFYRSELCNALNRQFKERENIKV